MQAHLKMPALLTTVFSCGLSVCTEVCISNCTHSFQFIVLFSIASYLKYMSGVYSEDQAGDRVLAKPRLSHALRFGCTVFVGVSYCGVVVSV